MSLESLLSRKAHNLGPELAFPGSWSFLRATRRAGHAGCSPFPGRPGISREMSPGESIAMVASSSSFGLALVHGPELKGN